LTFKILKNDLVTVLHRSVVRSAADPSHRNRRASFKSDVQESLKLLETKPSSTFVWKDSQHKDKSRNINKDVSNRTRSKTDYTGQHIGNRTRSKMHKLHMLDQTEEDNDMSWECHKVVDYFRENGDFNSSNHKCLVEWNDINKTKSWVNVLHYVSLILNL
jgi:hypothetical protein